MTKTLDRLTLLNTFVRIADRGSISAAARDLGLSQASASRQLQELEERFEADLIRRTTHSLSLTDAGLDLLADARKMLGDWEALEERHIQGDQEIAGSLKIVAPVALGQMQLADLAIEFQRRYPKVRLSWILQDDVIRFAETGCDCWIKVGPIPDDTLIIRQLGRVERLVVASSAFVEGGQIPKMPSKKEPLPFVTLNPFEGAKVQLSNKRGKRIDLLVDVQISTDNIFVTHKAALNGVGAAVLPRWFVEKDLQAGRLVDVFPKWRASELEVSVGYAPSRYQPSRLKRFLVELENAFVSISGIQAS